MGSNEIDLSVVIQTFNRPTALRTCLTRLRTHLLPHIASEVIVADDGSTDGSTGFVIDALPPDAVFRNEDKATFGPGYTMNRACELALGRYILFVEDDFWLTRDFTADDFAACMEAFEAIDHLGLIRLRVLDGEASSETRQKRYADNQESLHTFGGMEFALFRLYEDGGESYQYTNNAHIRPKELIPRIGGFPERVSIGGLENNMAGNFRANRIRFGSFRFGWFTHSGVTSTRQTSESYKGA